eukprot:jgi/Tetstr1/435335/TSEL_024253.t1
MARVQSSTPGGAVEWQFRCCDGGGCGRTYQRPAPMCTHVNHGMESDDPAVAALHLAYAATFAPSVYVRGTVFALRKDDPAAGEERAKTGEPLRVRPLGVVSVLVRLASAHALVQVGADVREAMGPTGFLRRMMPPSELDPFLAAANAANISAAFSFLDLDACDQSTPSMEAAIVQMSTPADFGGLNMALLQSEPPAAFYSAQLVVLPKMVREYKPALDPLYEAVRAEVSSMDTSALPGARKTRRVYETVRALTTLPEEDVRRARAAYGHAHEIFELLTVANGCRGLAT